MQLHPSLFCLFFCLLYFFLPPFKELGCFSGCLMSSASIQKLFCGIYSTFKCSFDEFVGETVFSLSYSSAILAPPSISNFLKEITLVCYFCLHNSRAQTIYDSHCPPLISHVGMHTVTYTHTLAHPSATHRAGYIVEAFPMEVELGSE